jgi:NDP-sugar pyrophosphorylase family protein
LSKLKKITDDFFLINCDTIININYLDFYNFHKVNNNDLTIVTCSKEFQIPYGCFEINGKGKMLKMVEKPKNNYLANTGLYLISSKLLSKIPKNIKVDFNVFLEKVRKSKTKIGFYTVDEHSWDDLGELSSFHE